MGLEMGGKGWKTRIVRFIFTSGMRVTLTVCNAGENLRSRERRIEARSGEGSRREVRR